MKALAGLLTAIVAVVTLLVGLGVFNNPSQAASTPSALAIEGRVLRERMHVNQQLRPGDALVSPSGALRLALDSSGDLVLSETATGARVWHPDDPPVQGGDRAILGEDGNFVVYDGDTPLWDTGTDQHPGAVLVLQDDFNLVVYASDGSPLWGSGTAR